MQGKGVIQRLRDSFVPLASAVARVEKEHIRRAIEQAQGNNEQAIRLLGIAKDTFYRKKKEYQL